MLQHTVYLNLSQLNSVKVCYTFTASFITSISFLWIWEKHISWYFTYYALGLWISKLSFWKVSTLSPHSFFEVSNYSWICFSIQLKGGGACHFLLFCLYQYTYSVFWNVWYFICVLCTYLDASHFFYLYISTENAWELKRFWDSLLFFSYL